MCCFLSIVLSLLSCCILQIRAEVKIAQLFPWHPLMAMVLHYDKDDEGNVVMVSPYAGVCLAYIQNHPDWRGRLTEQERSQVYAVIEAHSMKVLDMMQKMVSVLQLRYNLSSCCSMHLT